MSQAGQRYVRVERTVVMKSLIPADAYPDMSDEEIVAFEVSEAEWEADESVQVGCKVTFEEDL